MKNQKGGGTLNRSPLTNTNLKTYSTMGHYFKHLEPKSGMTVVKAYRNNTFRGFVFVPAADGGSLGRLYDFGVFQFEPMTKSYFENCFCNRLAAQGFHTVTATIK